MNTSLSRTAVRLAICALTLVGSSPVRVDAQDAAGAQAVAAAPLQSVDLPMTGKPQTVFIANRVFRPRENAGFHRHDGIELAQVISGTVEITEKGGSSKVYRAGESFVV